MPNLQPSRQDAAKELLRRRLGRKSLTEFARQALEPQGFAPARHHALLIRELEAVAADENDRLMVFMPPGSAKSTYASQLFPAWYLARRPGHSVIGASYTADLAEEFSGRVQGFINDNQGTLGYSLETDAKARWLTSNKGRYLAAGVGGPVAGFRADLALIDDPIKNRDQADSQTYRDKAWAWFKADLRTRMRPHGRIVLIQTRWHEDDLAGRLLNDQPGRWRVIKLPAIAGEDDQMGRAPGELLWGDDGYGYAEGVRSFLSENGEDRDWWSLYQQEPRALSGGVFKTNLISTFPAVPVGRTVRAWDLASVAGGGDWTVGLRLTRTTDDTFVVGDVQRFRGAPEEVEASLKATATKDGKNVPILLPQDPGQAGKSQIAYLTKKLMGWRVISSPESGSKATRAGPVASQCNIGNLKVAEGQWNRLFMDELASFPTGAKDDQVDALSRAFAGLIGGSYDSTMKWV